MKTAIDYIIGELLDNQTHQHDDYVTIDLSKDHLEYLINRAKAIEKEQIKDAWDNGIQWEWDSSISNSEEYYNKTFKSE
jgi:hypothetical protein